MNTKVSPLVVKYAFILIISYGVEFALTFWSEELFLIPFDTAHQPYTRLFGYGLALILNIIIALLLYTDSKKLKLSAPYVIIAALLFRPVGVFAFLIYVLTTKVESKQDPIDGIIDR